MRKIRKIILLIVPVLLIMGIAMMLFLFRMDKPPLDQVEAARKAITGARNNMAHIYAGDLYRESERFFDSAMSHIHRENEKNVLKRDFRFARDFAIRSATCAGKANLLSISESRDLQLRLKSRIISLKEDLSAKHDFFATLPLPDQVFTHNSLGRLCLSEAEAAFDKEDYNLSEEKLETAERHIKASFQAADDLLNEYFENYPEWQKWAGHTLSYSEQNHTRVVIVDKVARKIHLYHGGKLTHSFPIELGKNWIGDKRFKGDKATPEGYYEVADKKQHPHTKFYKALLLDYPNSDDIRRFKNDKNSGLLPRSAEIGGSIEIHGRGGKGNDWTDGCAALKNSDMDIVFRLTATGTRVTIVGSLSPLEDIWHESF